MSDKTVKKRYPDEHDRYAIVLCAGATSIVITSTNIEGRGGGIKQYEKYLIKYSNYFKDNLIFLLKLFIEIEK